MSRAHPCCDPNNIIMWPPPAPYMNSSPKVLVNSQIHPIRCSFGALRLQHLYGFLSSLNSCWLKCDASPSSLNQNYCLFYEVSLDFPAGNNLWSLDLLYLYGLWPLFTISMVSLCTIFSMMRLGSYSFNKYLSMGCNIGRLVEYLYYVSTLLDLACMCSTLQALREYLWNTWLSSSFVWKLYVQRALFPEQNSKKSLRAG